MCVGGGGGGGRPSGIPTDLQGSIGVSDISMKTLEYTRETVNILKINHTPDSEFQFKKKKLFMVTVGKPLMGSRGKG